MKKRVHSLLLAAMLFSAFFVACAGDGDAGQPGTNVTTAAPDTTLPFEIEPVDTRDTADLPDGLLPAEGFTLRILTLEASQTALTELSPETENGETLNEAMYLYSWGKVYTTLNGAVKARNENTASTIATLTKVAEQAIEDYVQAIKD